MATGNDIAAIGSAIYSRIGTAGTVGVYSDLAPQGSAPPYCIYQQQAAPDEYTFTSHMVSADYVVKIVSNRTWAGEAQQIYGHIHTLMQDAPLSVSGFSLMRCRRQSTIKYRDGDGFWHVGGLYRIDVHEGL